VPETTQILPPRYRGAKRIGKGGMGEIYRATDSTLGRAVAVKVLAARFAEDESVRERFTREALSAARLSGDPSIVTIYDVGEWESRPFIVMEYMSGGSLEQKLRDDGAQPTAQVVRWLEQAARALDHAQAEGVVHRDVKPGNLLLDREGNVHVADFGIASAAGMDSMTMTGTVMGTAGYLAPEQAQGERAGPASDRYALAVVAFELLTGTRPFESDTPTAEAAAHVNADIPAVSERGDLPPELDEVFRKALAKRPEDRYRSAAEFVAALRQAFDDAAGQTRALEAVAPTVPLVRSSRPMPLWPLILGGLVLAGIAGVILAAVLSRDDSKKPAPAVVKTVTAQGTTIRQTVTTAAPTTAPTATAAAPSADGHSLNDRGFALMQSGDFQGALPLLQQAVQKLQGTGPGDPYEGYANYNLGYTLLQLGECDAAVTALQRADQLEPHNKQVRNALKRTKHCG
jgi:predicted Ser/Thr protein kinase/tetratricopeptide (TPR) repeat protein